MDRIILTMKWGTLYSAEYVNVLYNAVKANMSKPFRFVCLTDDPSGIMDAVETYDIPDLGLPEHAWKSGAWPKLSVFSKDLHGLEGRALFVDLDTVVNGDITEMFDVPGALVCLDWAGWKDSHEGPSTMTSLFAFDIGKSSKVVDLICDETEAMLAKHANEQDYLHVEFSAVGYEPISYWPIEWLQSFKYHLRQPLLVDRFKHPKPPSSKILVFHGRPRPIDLINPPKGNWDLFPHYGRGRVPWMVDYWLGNGGVLKD